MIHVITKTIAVIIGIAISLCSYPIPDGHQIQGIPLPVAALERSANGEFLIPFSHTFSAIFLIANAVICIAVALTIENYVWSRFKVAGKIDKQCD